MLDKMYTKPLKLTGLKLQPALFTPTDQTAGFKTSSRASSLTPDTQAHRPRPLRSDWSEVFRLLRHTQSAKSFHFSKLKSKHVRTRSTVLNI